jgi:AcrR family transcriptional regulator
LPALTAPVEKPRKQPTQARSTATVEAILDATVQVLLAVGKESLTTTRVASRAGVSVGTLYQYYPNKRSLLQAALRRHLETVSDATIRACERHRGEPLCEMIGAIADAFFRAKLIDPKVSLAFYSVSSDVDGIGIIEDLRISNTRALADALGSAPEKLTTPLDLAAFMLQAAMTGVSRRLLEARIPAREHEALRTEMVAMLCAYLEARTKH